MDTKIRDTGSARRARYLRQQHSQEWTPLAPGYFSKNSAASTARRIKRDLIEGWAVVGPWDARVRKRGRRYFVEVKPLEQRNVQAAPAVDHAADFGIAPAREPEQATVDQTGGIWVEINGQRVRIGAV